MIFMTLTWVLGNLRSVKALLALFSWGHVPQTQTVQLVLSATSVIKYREEKSQEKVSTKRSVPQ